MTFSPFRLTTLALLVGLTARLTADETSPVELFRQFQIALVLKDEPTIRRLALPDPDLAVLWQGEAPDIEQLNSVYIAYKELKIVQYQVGEELSLGGRKITVTDQMVNDKTALVQRLIPGREEPPLPVVRVKGRWRMDARPFILPMLNQSGNSPRTSVPEAWADVAVIDQFLARSPGLWDARLVDLPQSSVAKSFTITPGDEASAVFAPGTDATAPTLFGKAVQAYALRFEDGLLSKVETTVYDAATAPAALTSAQVQEDLNRLDRNLRRLTGSKGRFRKKERDPEDRNRTLRAKEWQALGMLLRLEVVIGQPTMPADPAARAAAKQEAILALRLVASEDMADDGQAQEGDRSLSGEVRDALAKLRTGISPAADDFWQQTKTGFLGGFVDGYNAHWTQEQEQDALVSFRCSYIQTPHNEIRDKKPVCFIRNEPLMASRVSLFGHPVVSMIANFHEDRLVEFRFDFWNKGDGSVKDAYSQTKGIPEEDGKAACEDTLGLLRKAGLEFERKAGSQGKISRVRETHYTADAGPTRITFIVQKEEYYSLLLQSIRFLESQDEQPKERATAQETRQEAKERVIRIKTEEEAGQHPGEVKVGDVFLQVPMVDQGPKGYCAPATLTRVVQYYGHQTTMNEMAAMMETQGGGGTLVTDVLDGVRKVTRRLRLSFKEEDLPDKDKLDNQRRLDRWIDTAIIAYIDNGNPIFWTVPMHQRLIIGYNATTREILSSDSWGQKGYDRMPYVEAAKVTEGIWIIR